MQIDLCGSSCNNWLKASGVEQIDCAGVSLRVVVKLKLLFILITDVSESELVVMLVPGVTIVASASVEVTASV